jgi:hypothetical protein
MNKDSAYKTGTFGGRDSFCEYFDDPFMPCWSPYLQAVNIAYQNVRVVSDSNATTAQGFEDIIRSGNFQTVAVAAHGSNDVLAFEENNATQTGYVRQDSIPSIDAKTLFYIFHSCYVGSPGGFAEKIVFDSPKGLLAIGYTCVAPGPNVFYYPSPSECPFYPALDSGETFGEALKRIKNQTITRPWIYNPTSYATEIDGDGSLRSLIPQQQPGVEVNSTYNATNLILRVYPNPANRQTTIRYALSVKGQVSL